MEGQNLKKSNKKKIEVGEVWPEMGVKDALFIYLSEYIIFITCAGVEQFRKSEKLRRKRMEGEIVNFLRVIRRHQVPNMKNI